MSFITRTFYLSNCNSYFVLFPKFHIYISKFQSNEVKLTKSKAKVLILLAFNLCLVHAWPTQLMVPPSEKKVILIPVGLTHHIHTCQAYEFTVIAYWNLSLFPISGIQPWTDPLSFISWAVCTGPNCLRSLLLTVSAVLPPTIIFIFTLIDRSNKHTS